MYFQFISSSQYNIILFYTVLFCLLVARDYYRINAIRRICRVRVHICDMIPYYQFNYIYILSMVIFKLFLNAYLNTYFEMF